MPPSRYENRARSNATSLRPAGKQQTLEVILNLMSVRFSVLLPVYNRENYVRQAVDSVLNQTFRDFELLVIDDGSTDRSVEILKSYGSKLKLIQQRNQGPEIARNTAAPFAQGEYLVYLDSDDFFLPFALETFDKVIRATDFPPLLLGSILFFQDGESPPLPPAPDNIEIFKFKNYASKTMSLSSNSTVVRKSVFDAVGGGRRDSTPRTFHADDTYIQLRVGDYSPFVVIKKPYTSAYRLHGENTSRNVQATADGILRLIRLDRQGEFGKPSWNRYAFLGGRALAFAYRDCWRNGERKSALRLLLGAGFMGPIAIINLISRRFRKPPEPIILR
jgi:glycosyltransferase involved in cell wall biosynthesis